MTLTVRDFIREMYDLINPSNPTTPLHGDDQDRALKVLNRLIASYAATGLLLTIAKTVTAPINNGNFEIIFTDPDYPPPTDPKIVQIAEGRLANFENAWLILGGVTYPLINPARSEYLSAWRYDPLQGLPRFFIIFPDTNIVTGRFYPAPSQFYQFYCRGKFQRPPLTINDNLDDYPEYSYMFLLFAVGRYVAPFKARGYAWTPDLEAKYQELENIMVAASEVNLNIVGDRASMLNGAALVRAGI